MDNRWNHLKAGTEVQRSGSGPGNELNPMGSYRAATEGPFRISILLLLLSTELCLGQDPTDDDFYKIHGRLTDLNHAP